MKTGIERINAGKVFITPEGEHEVVRDLSFATKENEFLVLFGPGQCGKTTIINMIAGFEDVTSGQVLADGKKVEKPEPSRGVVFQNIALFHMSEFRFKCQVFTNFSHIFLNSFLYNEL